ncbi:acyl-CoA (8-3)-desaturase [Anolis carolinensis]|uniref:acyl-CoA (8-3)-desaturase n=1 Tax=Anolis carolinensis TaxID=28377 RepID=UPI002F2B553B
MSPQEKPEGAAALSQGARAPFPRRFFTWDEIRVRTRPEDPEREMWLVLERRVYDVRRFRDRHPGGSRILLSHVGQEATDAFAAFHGNKTLVNMFLNPLLVGELAPDQPTFEPSKNESLIMDFRELCTTVEKMGLMKPNSFYFLALLFHILLLDVASWLILIYFGTSLLPFVASLGLLTIAQVQAAWLQHDLGHLSVFEKTKWNHLLHQFVMCHLIGASAKWWTLLHSQHHAKPNCFTKDPDTDIHPFLFTLGKSLSVELGTKKIKYMPYNYQHRYFFVTMPPLLFPAFFHFHTFYIVFKKKLWVDLAWQLSCFIRLFLVQGYLLGPKNFLLYYFLFRYYATHCSTNTSRDCLGRTLSICKLNYYFFETAIYFSFQLQATCNVHQSYFNDWFTGHLNFQIEHHLFPRMPRHNFWKVTPLVKSLCHKYGIEYKCKPLLTAFADILHSLKDSGELWLDAYLHK